MVRLAATNSPACGNPFGMKYSCPVETGFFTLDDQRVSALHDHEILVEPVHMLGRKTLPAASPYSHLTSIRPIVDVSFDPGALEPGRDGTCRISHEFGKLIHFLRLRSARISSHARRIVSGTRLREDPRHVMSPGGELAVSSATFAVVACLRLHRSPLSGETVRERSARGLSPPSSPPQRR